MKISDYDIHLPCAKDFMSHFDEITKESKSKEQEEFESLILGSKHFGNTASEDLTKDGENESLMTKSTMKKNVKGVKLNQADTTHSKEDDCHGIKLQSDKASPIRNSYPMASKCAKRKPSENVL